MICVSIARGRHKHMRAEHQHLAENGARLVELRLDYIRRAVTLKRLLKDRKCPVVATCRRPQDGGKWTASEAERVILLRAAIVEGVDYVDLEEEIAEDIPRYGSTKRIISMHDFDETPENLEEIHARLASKDADIVKLACMANSPHDVTRMLKLIEQSEIPTVGICMGDIGMSSRLLAGKFGAPFSFATFHHERTIAPGQLSFQEMKEIYGYESINAETEVFGVIADPVGHSMSPVIHNAGFDHLDMNRVYLPFRVPKDHLDQFIDDAPSLGIRGLSVTIPHKQEVMASLTKIESGARKIGAVNTVVFEGNEIVGYNTDLYGAMVSLAEIAGADPDEKWLSGKKVLLLGAGGVARAIGVGVKDRGAELMVASRTYEKAVELAAKLEGAPVSWEERHSTNADVLVNCTPVGMHPNMNETPFEEAGLRRGMIVFDTIYNPEQTLLIKQARDHGCRVVTGVEMFVRQAELQFRLFSGEKAPVDVMRETFRRTISSANY
ncbi:MAG: 3-dehydroquinate dehydratase [Planctomycetaceae bacterium]|nr:3-dehydroquinate dehydratase [Planctomycetaceae bacterium]